MHPENYALLHLQATNQQDALEVQASSASGLQAFLDLHAYSIYKY